MAWLPRDFDGPRSFEEVASDLREIGRYLSTCKAHVAVDRHGHGYRLETGDVAFVKAARGRAYRCLVDGREAFDLRAETFRHAWLHTIDGADYYILDINLTDGRVQLSDAYNGL